MTKPQYQTQDDVAQLEYKATIAALEKASQPKTTGGRRSFRAITSATGLRSNFLSSLLNDGVEASYLKTRRLQSFLIGAGHLSASVISDAGENLKALNPMGNHKVF